MCTILFCMVGCGIGALWDLWIWSINSKSVMVQVIVLHQTGGKPEPMLTKMQAALNACFCHQSHNMHTWIFIYVFPMHTVYLKNFHDLSDICPMGFQYSIQICEIYHQTFGPSHRKCPMCPMIFTNTVCTSWISSSPNPCLSQGLECSTVYCIRC